MHTTTQIWNEYNAKLHAFIVRRVSDRSTADDILQDVFLKTHRRLHELKDGAKLQSWLYQIARNAIIDHYRERRLSTESLEELPADGPDASDAAVRELAECLRPMIEQLPEHYRDALILADLDGMTQREIAERHGISLSGSKSRVQRARTMLRDQLDACCRFEFDRRGSVVGYTPHACADDCESDC
jgi:RNA polymerase sigma-70 factor (ECF subfamily)